MGVFDNLKAFVHSITTDDHYASYGSPYKNSGIGRSSNVVGGHANGSSSRLHELNRLATANSSSHSLVDGQPQAASGPVGYRPGLRSLSTVQLQTFNNGQPPLPSIESLWHRIEAWLEEEYPELEDNLNDGVTTADLNEFENDLGLGSLPVEFRQFYKIHDGQFRGGKPTGLVMGLTLLDIESIVEEYAIWAKVSQRLEKQQYIAARQRHNTEEGSSSSQGINNDFVANQKSVPANSIQPYYVHRGWIPFIRDGMGNQFALDLAPGPAGQWGQVILFGRDFDTKVVIANSFQEFVFGLVNDLEAGNFQIDNSESRVDDGFLDTSRDDDYAIGEEEGEGELSFYDKSGKEFGAKLKGKLTYVEVWKRRALKKHGVTNVTAFQTAFTPKRIPVARNAAASLSSVAVNKEEAKSPLIGLETKSDVTLPKETLIGTTEAPVDKPEDKSEEAPKVEETKSEDKLETKPENQSQTKSEDKPEEKSEAPEQRDATKPDVGSADAAAAVTSAKDEA